MQHINNMTLWCNYRFPWRLSPGTLTVRVTQEFGSCWRQRVCHIDHRRRRQRDTVTNWRHVRRLHGQHCQHRDAALHHYWQLQLWSVPLSSHSGSDQHAHQSVSTEYVPYTDGYYRLLIGNMFLVGTFPSMASIHPAKEAAKNMFLFSIYTVSQKKLGHFYFYCNFGKCWSILKILLLLESEGSSW